MLYIIIYYLILLYYYTIIHYYILYYTLLLFCSIFLPSNHSFQIYPPLLFPISSSSSIFLLFLSLLPHPNPSSHPFLLSSLFLSPLIVPSHSFYTCRYLLTVIYIHLMFSSDSKYLTPHVLSEWMVEV